MKGVPLAGAGEEIVLEGSIPAALGAFCICMQPRYRTAIGTGEPITKKVQYAQLQSPSMLGRAQDVHVHNGVRIIPALLRYPRQSHDHAVRL